MMINGTVIKSLNQKENDWGRYVIRTDKGEELTTVGVIPGVSIGSAVTLEAQTEKTEKYGEQIKILKVMRCDADIYAGIRSFLCDGYIKGLGVKKADLLIETFGKESLDLLETEDGRKLIMTVKGIKEATLNKVLESYEENKKYKDIVLFLNGYGTQNQVLKIYDTYGNNAVSVLSKNPYRLQMDLDGFGFKKTDSIALSSGIKKDSVYRIMAAVKYIIEESEMSEGHCYLTMDEIRGKIMPLLLSLPTFKDLSERTNKVIYNTLNEWDSKREDFIKKHMPSEETLKELDTAFETQNLIRTNLYEAISEAIADRKLINDDGCLYTEKMYNVETETAKILSQMASSAPVRTISKELIEQSIREIEKKHAKTNSEKGLSSVFSITEEQKKAIHLGLRNRLSIISGGPGRGKTTICEVIAHTFLSSFQTYDRENIIMLAPTGRAAQRITESTGYEAKTIHRAIMSGDIPKGKLIIVDESSMIDIYLAHKFIKYAKDCNVIFVGDADQLPSVGPGKFLSDMIQSGKIPTILLKQGHRNSGTIARNAELINAGKKLETYTHDEHFVYRPANSANIFEVMVSDFKKKAGEYGIRNVMLCVAMRERGPISVNKLNQRLQAELTAGKAEAVFGSKIFRVGDRVMQTKNDYNFVVMRKKGEQSIYEKGIFNGERGTVAKILPDPEEDSYKLVIVYDDGSIGGYTKNTAQNLTLAYATTVHKCQGSEAPCVMMGYVFGDYLLVNRALFYTAVTRAKKEFRCYGEEKIDETGRLCRVFDTAVHKVDAAKRNTKLAARL